MLRAPVPLLILFLFGCNELVEPQPTRGLSLIPVESTYQVGETAEARLVNDSDRAIGYNLCLAMWDLRVDGDWRRVVPARMCPQEVYYLDPGEEVLLRETVDEGWQRGTYRFVLDVNPVGEDERPITVVSEPFEVTD
jgi:hypothetical protein